ncbi:MAG: hypothetical protein FJW39_01250 [Acidobacteria bacterium]|nr:hypothetical protein [Acidobacteriota bacterium]
MSSGHHSSNGPGYETTDANVPAIIKMGVGILVLVAFAFGLMGLCYFALDSIRNRLEPSQATQMQLQKYIPANVPMLQVDQALDLRVQRAKDHEVMHGPATQDPKTGAVRIPIDRAIDILAERGLPEIKGQPAAAAPKPAAARKQ